MQFRFYIIYASKYSYFILVVKFGYSNKKVTLLKNPFKDDLISRKNNNILLNTNLY